MAAAINTYQTAVIFVVTVKATGEQFYAVPTGDGDGSCYHITVQRGALTCNCPDCVFRKRACKHIIALAAHLKEKRATSIIRQAEQIAAEACHPVPTTPARCILTEQERRDPALPYTDDKAFSMFKS